MTKSTSGDKCYWVIVADQSNAIVYAHDSKSGPLRDLFSLDNSAGRKSTDELISDSGGRSFDSRGKGRHTMSKEKTDPRKHAAMVFAKKIAQRIEKAMHDGSCRGFALVAAPRFLGVLRDAVAVATTAEPYATIDKEMVDQDAVTIEKLLAEL